MRFFFCILVLLSLAVFAGEPVKISRDSRVDALLNKHIKYNQTAPVSGYRINIYSQSGNNSHSAAVAAQAQFAELFPEMKSYLSFEEPYFKVKVGNFRTRLEATATLTKLQTNYPQAYVVRDNLDLQDLLGIETPVTDSVVDVNND